MPGGKKEHALPDHSQASGGRGRGGRGKTVAIAVKQIGVTE